MTATGKYEISIIIVNYKTPKLLHDCVLSIINNKKDISLEIIVVDNNSEDESENIIKQNFSEVKWINTGYNAGFSRANNAGIRVALGEYILLLNSDTIIIGDCLQKTLTKFKSLEKEKSNLGLLGCKMKGPDESILFNSNLSFPGLAKLLNANPIKIFLSRKRKKTDEEVRTIKELQHSKDHSTAWLGVAFALCNRKLFDKDNLFMDEDFFMYSEDLEWCHRISKKGYRHYFYSDAEIYHINCGSSGFSEWKTGQIIISDWLYIYKTRCYFYFLIYITLLRFNLFVDNQLYLRNTRKNKINNEDILSYNLRRLISSLIKIYFGKIRKNYKSEPSSAKEYLKYNV